MRACASRSVRTTPCSSTPGSSTPPRRRAARGSPTASSPLWRNTRSTPHSRRRIRRGPCAPTWTPGSREGTNGDRLAGAAWPAVGDTPDLAAGRPVVACGQHRRADSGRELGAGPLPSRPARRAHTVRAQFAGPRLRPRPRHRCLIPVLPAARREVVPDRGRLPHGPSGLRLTPPPRTPLTIQDFAMSLDGIVGSLHLENPIFVGHSMGAQVVTELLVLGKQASKIVHEAGAVLVGPPVNAAERRLRTQLVRFAQSSRHESNEVRRLATNAYLACGVDWFATVVPSMTAYPIEERIRLLPCPVTFLRGEYDEVAPQAWIDFLGREAGADVDDERAGS